MGNFDLNRYWGNFSRRLVNCRYGSRFLIIFPRRLVLNSFKIMEWVHFLPMSTRSALVFPWRLRLKFRFLTSKIFFPFSNSCRIQFPTEFHFCIKLLLLNCFVYLGFSYLKFFFCTDIRKLIFRKV